nr:protein LURP-one-related 6 [Ipomoea trifida]
MGSKASGRTIKIMPIVSKLHCSVSEEVLVVRHRPHVVNGGGFVVTDSAQNPVFSADGCGVLGNKDEIILRDSYGSPLLLIRRKGGIVEVLSMTRKWKGYTTEFEGSQKLVFTLKEPNSSCFFKNIPVKISIESSHYGGDHRSFAVAGYFPNRVCSIVDSLGNAIAQVGGCKEIEMESKDIYNVIVKPGIDQAFVIGVIAILDYIYGGSTRC